MNITKIRKAGVILAHAFIGWILCGAIVWIGRSVTTLQTALIIHAIGTFVNLCDNRLKLLQEI